MLRRLREHDQVDWERASLDAAGVSSPLGLETGANPTDRGKLGSKRHIVVDAHRWVVERAHAWFAGFGKLRTRFERRLDIHVALLSLVAAVICSRVGRGAALPSGNAAPEEPCVRVFPHTARERH